MANGLFGGGEGTAESPFLIEDGQDILKINEKLRTYPFYHFKLANDVDMSSIEYSMIGDTNSGPPFMGVFDGDGFTVTGITLNKATGSSETSFAMFKNIDGNQAIVKNLTVKNFTVSSNGSDSVAILAANIGSGATIENCYIEGTIKAKSAYVGGLGVWLSKAIIKNVVVKLHAEGQKAGAFAYSATDGLIENCTVLGELNGFNKDSVLAGLVRVTGGAAVIKNSLSKVNLSNKYDGDMNASVIAPFVDDMAETATLENSFILVDGLLYPEWNATETYYINRVVKGSDSKLYVCHNYQVKGTSDAKPISGSNWADYWKLHDVTNGLNKDQLKDKSIFTGWDFENTWVMGADGPELKAFYTPSEEIPGGGDDTPSDIVIVTDVDFTKTKMMHDVLGRVIPQVWDHENNRFVPVTLQMIELMIKR